MPRNMFRTNARSFAYGAAVFAALGALAASTELVLLRIEKTKFLASRLDYLSVVADLKAQSIRDFHENRLHDLDIYISSIKLVPGFPDGLYGDAAKLRVLEKLFDPMLTDNEYASVTLMDRRGRIVLSVPSDAETPRPSGGPAGAPRFLGIRRNGAGLPVLDYETAIAGGGRLLVEARADALTSPVTGVWPGTEKTAETLLFQRDGKSLLAVNEFRHLKNSALALRLPLDSGILAARAARGEPGPLFGLDYRRVPCYAAVRNMPEIGWVLVVKVDEEELLAPLLEKIRMIVLVSLAAFVLVALLVALYLRSKTDRLRAETDSERLLLSTAIEQVGESVVITDKNGLILYTNPAFSRASGYTREEALGKTPSVLKSGRQDESFYKNMWETLARGESWQGRFINKRKDGSFFEEEATITPVRDASGAVSHYIAVKRDISAVKTLEDQLYHSQKMEAIGRLAGGIAHDFNNILTTINGYAEMLVESTPAESQSAGDIAEILGAGRRASLLTRQLLTFSRRAPSDPVVLDLRVSIRAIEKMLRRTLGEDVRLTLELPPEPLWVKTDPGQIDQVLMNLAVNARDAMPRGGGLSLRASESRFETDEIRTLEIIPAGRYATLVVTDDGVGMDGATLSRIFEPFFTTKEKGKGTGLGLATVFGVVKQNKGHITVDSAPGRGSTFTIFLPLVPAPAEAPVQGALAGVPSLRGDETILVVEDQSEVLRLVARALTPQGYRVIACESAEKALEAARTTKEPIHLLLTDVVMPGMSGEELAHSMRQIRPATKILYMSGYTDGRLDKLGESGEKVDLLLKPFTVDQVCRRVRDALDGAAPRIG